jgi:plasmid stabilization system protein ParE
VHRLEWKKLARLDLIKIVEHIAEDNPDAADKLADEIESKAQARAAGSVPSWTQARHQGDGGTSALRRDLQGEERNY